jgi:hypothetical protein
VTSPTPKPHERDLDLTQAQWLAAPDAPHGPQVAFVDEYIVLRKGDDESAPVLIFTPDEWKAFRAGATDGEFNNLL